MRISISDINNLLIFIFCLVARQMLVIRVASLKDVDYENSDFEILTIGGPPCNMDDEKISKKPSAFLL